MKNLFVLAVASLIATSANAAEMKWSGSTGWRYEQTKNDDNLNSKVGSNDTSALKTKTHAIRANLGVTGGWENVEYGFGVRTNAGAANDDHLTVQNNLDRALGIEQAWFRYLKDFGSMDLAVTIGRQKNVIAYDTVSQNLYDNDVRWDGAGWQFKFGMFGMNAAQYITGARTVAAQGIAAGTDGASSYSRTEATVPGRKFNYLMSFQPYVNWKFNDDIETMFAVGYHHWSDSSKTNATGGGVNAAATNTGTVPAIANSNFNMHNGNQWHFLSTWTLPYNLSFNAEYVMNKKQAFNTGNVTGYAGNVFPEASKSAWSASLTYGALKKAQDFTVGYSYGNKGLASVVNAYSYEKFAADNKGHSFSVGYAIADNFHLGWKGLFLKEKEKINASSAVAGTAGRAYSGANAAQENKTTYMELSAGVMF